MPRQIVNAVVRRAHALLLLLLPRRLRSRVYQELRAAFDDGAREQRSRGAVAYTMFVLKEWGGVLAMAVMARRATSGARAGPRRDRQPVGSLLSAAIQDIHVAVRILRRQPLGAALAILTFAVGIGASSSMYAIVDTVLLRPLPFPDSDRLISIWNTVPEWRNHPTLSDGWDRGVFSPPEFEEWRATQTTFVHAAALFGGTATLTGTDEPDRIAFGSATWELFPMLGVAAERGRLFDANDGGPGSPRAVVLSNEFWRARFGGGPDVIGKAIRLNDHQYTVIGVLPSWFEVADLDASLWTPIGGLAREEDRNDHRLRVIGRLADGVSLATARVEAERLLTSSTVGFHNGHGANLVPWLQDVTRDARAPLVLLVAAAIVLLAVACANVSALILGAGVAREHELAIRGALGAGRHRLIRQLVTESLLLAAFGGASGVLFAAFATRALVQLAPEGIPRLDLVTLDLRVVAFTVVLTAFCGMTFGLVPAFSLSRTDLARFMTGTRGARSSGTRVQTAIVLTELILVTVLLVITGLLTRTVAQLNEVDPGFDTDGILTIRTAPPFQRYFGPDASEDGPARLTAYYREIAEALRSLPGVTDVALTSLLPFSGQQMSNSYRVDGYEAADGEVLSAARYFVSGNYMHLMRMRLEEGRLLEAADDRLDAPRVVVVNESLAHHVGQGQSVLGKRFTFWETDYTVVGVVDDVRQFGLARSAGHQFYASIGGRPGQSASYVIHTTGDPMAIAPLVRDRIWSVGPDVPVTSVMSMNQRVHGSILEQRYRSRLMVTFSVLAVFMTLLGVYGVTSRAVACHTRELGIRIALGAERHRVMALVLRQGLRLAIAGGAIGVAASLFTARVIESFLFGVAPRDPATMVGVVLTVSSICVLASAVPALRATRVDPLRALRE